MRAAYAENGPGTFCGVCSLPGFLRDYSGFAMGFSGVVVNGGREKLGDVGQLCMSLLSCLFCTLKMRQKGIELFDFAPDGRGRV